MAAQETPRERPGRSLQEVKRTLDTIIPAGQITELRIFGIPYAKGQGTYKLSGYFDNTAAAVTALKNAPETTTAEGVYFIPNPIHPDLFARAANILHRAQKDTSTGDKDITARRWLLIDADPVRTTGISATDAEHTAAHDRMFEVRAWLDARGWASPIVADSGNGAHAMYRIDLPNDEESTTLVKRCLQALTLHFSDETVNIDTSVGTAARIWKLYGTIAGKGSHLAERPHRQTRIVELPEHLHMVTRDQLEALATTLPPETPAAQHQPEHTYKGAPFNIERWITDYGLDVKSPHSWQGKTVWPFRTCPFNAEHKNGDAAIIRFPSGAPYFHCFHNSCQGRTWQDVRVLYEPDCYTRTPKNITDFTPRSYLATDTNDDAAFQITSNQTYDNTDTGNAKRLLDGYGHLIRYVVEWKQWIVWNGKKWEIDLVNARVMRLAVRTVSHIKKQAETLIQQGQDPEFTKNKTPAEILAHEDRAKALYKHAMTSQNKRPYESMIFIAQAFSTIKAEKLDADPLVINMPNGTFDIRTNSLREHCRDDLITRMTRASYAPNASAPQWHNLIAWAMCNRPNLIAYLQRAYGYGITGNVSEDKIFFEYGKGSNGKSIIAEAIYHQLGDYAGRVDKETLLHKQNKGSSNYDVAQLEGKRFTIAGENNEGDRLDEGTIKTLLEHDQHGRAPYSGYRDFPATHKIFYYTNHLPDIKSNTRATWRRIAVIPFDATALQPHEITELSPEERTAATIADPHLSEHLQEESAGIMLWALTGAVLWYQNGLGTCKEILDATAGYQKDMDTTGQFLMECTRAITPENDDDESKGTQARTMYSEYLIWCETIKEHPMKQRAFFRALEGRGHPLTKKTKGMFFSSLVIDLNIHIPAPDAETMQKRNTPEIPTTPDDTSIPDVSKQSTDAETMPFFQTSPIRARTHMREVLENAHVSASASEREAPESQATPDAIAPDVTTSFLHVSASDPSECFICSSPGPRRANGKNICDKHYGVKAS